MPTENQLIMKSYYQSLINENEQEHPIRVLGDMYIEEMKEEQPDLSAIRFAQGEVYFINHDYEAAIYKWQHPLENPFIPWGQKNIADAHMEMGLLEYAEKFYKEVETDSVTLKTEVLLQLFSLYIQQDQVEKAVDTIKKAVQLNPDYTDVTEIAKRYFETIHDWNNAIELAVNEAIRTESLFWFGVLEEYAEQHLTSRYRPNYYNNVLATLYAMDKYRFERLTNGLWENFKQSDFYFEWLEEMNLILLGQNIEVAYNWQRLPILFREGYFYLMSGEYLIHDISDLLEDHLANWYALSPVSNRIPASTAILAWDERFPEKLPAALVEEAKQQLESSSPNQARKQEGIELSDSINRWAEQEGLFEEVTELVASKLAGVNMEEASPTFIRDVIKEKLTYLLDQKVELENVILREIDWNEEILTELEEFHQDKSELELEKASILTRSFADLKDKLIERIQVKLPEILKGCTDFIEEDSDLANLHVALNEEMNKRIALYMRKEVLPEFTSSFQGWLETSRNELEEIQLQYNELKKKINEQFNEDKLELSGDFKVLDDWKRDIERTSRILLRLEDVNILLRNNPSQLLLKGAGKLLGSFTKNKEVFFNKYKDYIENADYREVAEDVTKTFIQQLELFEQSIEWDVSRFFRDPQEELRQLIEEVQLAIEEENISLTKRRENPEIYRDPLTLFEIKLRQYELMNAVEVVN